MEMTGAVWASKGKINRNIFVFFLFTSARSFALWMHANGVMFFFLRCVVVVCLFASVSKWCSLVISTRQSARNSLTHTEKKIYHVQQRQQSGGRGRQNQLNYLSRNSSVYHKNKSKAFVHDLCNVRLSTLYGTGTHSHSAISTNSVSCHTSTRTMTPHKAQPNIHQIVFVFFSACPPACFPVRDWPAVCCRAAAIQRTNYYDWKMKSYQWVNTYRKRMGSDRTWDWANKCVDIRYTYTHTHAHSHTLFSLQLLL